MNNISKAVCVLLTFLPVISYAAQGSIGINNRSTDDLLVTLAYEPDNDTSRHCIEFTTSDNPPITNRMILKANEGWAKQDFTLNCLGSGVEGKESAPGKWTTPPQSAVILTFWTVDQNGNTKNQVGGYRYVGSPILNPNWDCYTNQGYLMHSNNNQDEILTIENDSTVTVNGNKCVP